MGSASSRKSCWKRSRVPGLRLYERISTTLARCLASAFGTASGGRRCTRRPTAASRLQRVHVASVRIACPDGVGWRPATAASPRRPATAARRRSPSSSRARALPPSAAAPDRRTGTRRDRRARASRCTARSSRRCPGSRRTRRRLRRRIERRASRRGTRARERANGARAREAMTPASSMRRVLQLRRRGKEPIETIAALHRRSPARGTRPAMVVAARDRDLLSEDGADRELERIPRARHADARRAPQQAASTADRRPGDPQSPRGRRATSNIAFHALDDRRAAGWDPGIAPRGTSPAWPSPARPRSIRPCR